MKLGGVMLGTEDPKKLSEFYQNVFGKPSFQDGDWYGFDVGGGGLMIGFHSEVKGQNSSPARIMIMIESKDIKNEVARIAKLGAKIVAEPYQPDKNRDPEVWLATIADPDNNYLQFSTPWKD